MQFWQDEQETLIQKHSQAKIDLEEYLSTQIVSAVQEGGTELGIRKIADGAGDPQTLPYTTDHLVCVVLGTHALFSYNTIQFSRDLVVDQVGLHANSSIYPVIRNTAAALGCTVRVRIWVTRLEACAA